MTIGRPEREEEFVGEFELLARVRERLPPPGPRLRLGAGDDAAITVPGGATATSVDAIVEGIHFRRDRSSLRQIGGKALATALSDLAAMGAESGEAYTVLCVPESLGEDDCLELLDGIASLAAQTGTTLAGGDLVRSSTLAVAVTVVGHAGSADDLVTRAGSHPGDALVLTGELGGAAAGLLLLERPELAAAVAPAVAERLLARQLEPCPRLAAGLALARAGATAMIDLSDGLAGDAGHLSQAAGVALEIEAEALPLQEGVAELAEAAGVDPLALAASSGEDYELLAAIPVEGLDLRALAREAGVGVARVGAVCAGAGARIRLPGGRALPAGGHDQLG